MSSGVILTAFGGPDSLESVGPFMERLMGRPPSAEMIEAVQARYRAIGGASPLPAIATSIRDGLHHGLESRGMDVPVELGMRYWHPFIGEAIDAMVAAGVDRVVAVSLSPFESKVSSVAYREAVVEAQARHRGLRVTEAPMLHEAPAFAEALADGARVAVERARAIGRTSVLFTAHSLPLSDLLEDDPYVRELRAMCEDLAERLRLPGAPGTVRFGEMETYGAIAPEISWAVSYQSKGRRPGGWLEPDIDELMEAAAAEGYEAVAACPVGFATDHMETVYDLDIVAAERARELGLGFVRAEVPNDRPLLVEALRSLVQPLL